MPIRITTIGRQRTVAGLAKALFDTKGSAALQERAEAALLRANPQLAEEGGIKAGMSIIVPKVADLSATDDAAPKTPSPPPPPGSAPAAGIAADSEPSLALIRRRTQTLVDLGGRSLAAALDGAKQGAKELKLEETAAALLAARPDFGDRLEAARGEADKEVKRITDAGKDLRRITALAFEDLAALGDLMKPGG